MTHPVNVSSEDLAATAQNPVLRLLSGLSTDNPDQITPPGDIEKVLDWTRSYKPGDPQYTEKLALETDYRHLGFFDETGALIPELVTVGRKFLKENWTETPQYSRLWRHIQAHLETVQPEDVSADFTKYSTHIANLIDQGEGNFAVALAVVAADRNGMSVPTTALCQAHRFQFILASFPEAKKKEMIKVMDGRISNWFPPDNVANVLRQLLKDQHYGLSETEVNAWIVDNGSASLSRQIKAAFGNRSKARNLQDLGLIDKDWQWSENGFLRHRAIIHEATKNGHEPNFEWLRWETHQRHQADGAVPFSWALMNDSLLSGTVHRARRVASVALSGGLLGETVEVGETITPAQYATLRKVGAWLIEPQEYGRKTGLWWIGLLARKNDINWGNLNQCCSFIFDKLDQRPDLELLKDWREGVVTFEGQGRHQANSAKPFKGAQKVGRNDPCPCGSGKKHKKCCGL